MAVKIESAIGLPAKVLLAAQTQYELETANPASDNNEKETIAITTSCNPKIKKQAEAFQFQLFQLKNEGIKPLQILYKLLIYK